MSTTTEGMAGRSIDPNKNTDLVCGFSVDIDFLFVVTTWVEGCTGDFVCRESAVSTFFLQILTVAAINLVQAHEHVRKLVEVVLSRRKKTEKQRTRIVKTTNACASQKHDRQNTIPRQRRGIVTECASRNDGTSTVLAIEPSGYTSERIECLGRKLRLDFRLTILAAYLLQYFMGSTR